MSVRRLVISGSSLLVCGGRAAHGGGTEPTHRPQQALAQAQAIDTRVTACLHGHMLSHRHLLTDEENIYIYMCDTLPSHAVTCYNTKAYNPPPPHPST